MKYSTNESTGLLKNQGIWKNTDIGLEPMFRNFPSELPPPILYTNMKNKRI